MAGESPEIPAGNIDLEPHDTRDAKLDGQIQLLRDQVDLLQIQAGERKKPWYRERSMLFSVASLLVALFAAGERVYERLQETVNKKVADLGGITIQLADVQSEWQRSSKTADYAESVALNTKRELLLQSAYTLLKERSTAARTSPHIYMMLGYQMLGDGRYKDAQDFYNKAIDAAHDDPLARVWAQRALAYLYRMRGIDVDMAPDLLLAASRRLFAEAVDVFDKRDDDFSIQTVAETLATQGQIEMFRGETIFAKTRFDAARQRLGQMTIQNLAREKILSAIADAERSAQLAAAASVSPMPGDVQQNQDRGGNTELEIWRPVPGSASGAQMSLLIDGASKGTISNLGSTFRTRIGQLSNGQHDFELKDVAIYAIDAAGASTQVAAGLQCKGTFHFSGAAVLRLGFGGNNLGTQCAIQ